MMGAGSEGYDVNARYSLGVGLGFAVTRNLSIEAGYTFNEYGVAMAYSNYGYGNGYNGNSTANETVAMKQNLVDLGLKFHVMGPDSRIRPFVSGGAAYSKAFVNYDQEILKQQQQYYGGNNAPDYEVSSFLGYLGTGLDVRISRAVSLGGNFRYYGVFSSRENQPFNNGAAYSNYYYQTETQQVGGSLAKRGFYTLFAGLTFVF
jgi:outer membrane protein W